MAKRCLVATEISQSSRQAWVPPGSGVTCTRCDTGHVFLVTRRTDLLYFSLHVAALQPHRAQHCISRPPGHGRLPGGGLRVHNAVRSGYGSVSSSFTLLHNELHNAARPGCQPARGFALELAGIVFEQRLLACLETCQTQVNHLILQAVLSTGNNRWLRAHSSVRRHRIQSCCLDVMFGVV